MVEHQAADHNVISSVGRVDRLGCPWGERTVPKVGPPSSRGDGLCRWIDPYRRAARSDGLGHQSGEIAISASHIDDLVARLGAAQGDQTPIDGPSATGEEHPGEQVVRGTVSSVLAE